MSLEQSAIPIPLALAFEILHDVDNAGKFALVAAMSPGRNLGSDSPFSINAWPRLSRPARGSEGKVAENSSAGPAFRLKFMNLLPHNRPQVSSWPKPREIYIDADYAIMRGTFSRAFRIRRLTCGSGFVAVSSASG